MLCSETRRGLHGVQGHFELAQDGIGPGDHGLRCIHIGGGQAIIGGAGHGDQVLPRTAADQNQSHPAGRFGALTKIPDVDSLAAQTGPGRAPKVVTAVHSDERYARAGSRRSHGLVCTLASGVPRKLAPGQRLARTGQTRALQDQISIGTSNHNDPGSTGYFHPREGKPRCAKGERPLHISAFRGQNPYAPSSPPMDLKAYLGTCGKRIDRALDRFLPRATVKPRTIHEAMRYSLFAGGKRLRPALTLAAAEACGGEAETALPAACAVECIHTYSLIHDDLPCMDDDDLRRGRPTSHKVYGEGIAVLAGDALLTIAFEILAQAKETSRYKMPALIRELATASGSRWLIGGQVADLQGEGKKITGGELKYIHRCKTAALLTASIRLGAMSANVSPAKLQNLTDFGQSLGLAFQVIDDILDVTQTTEKLGKTAGKDVAATKATYPAIFGLERSREEAHRLTVAAHDALEPFGKNGATLRAFADYLLMRDY